jgi:lysophospholipase L1-like esterase
MKWKKLVILGDSITQGGWSRVTPWVSDLSDLLQRKCDVINRGFYGYNTNNVRVILPQIFDEFDAETVCGVILMLGSNDSATSVPLHVPTEVYESNLKFMVGYMKEFGIDSQRIVLMSPPKKDDERWVEFLKAEYPDEITDQFNHLVAPYVDIVRKIATEENVQFLDFNEAMEKYEGDYKELLSDGLHLNEKGSNLLFTHLKPIIENSIAPTLRQNFPEYLELQEGQTEIRQ